jgi:hypothetical protein
VTSLGLSGEHLLLAEAGSGLQIMNVANPALPALSSALDGGMWITQVNASGGRVIALTYQDILFLDLESIGSIQPQHAFATLSWAIMLQVVNNLGYIAAGNDGLQIFDLTNPAAIQYVSSYRPNTFADIEAVHVVGNVAYLASSQRGLDIVDISNPRAPVPLGTYPTAVSSMGTVRLQAVGNRLYMAHEQGLAIFDISAPSQPKLQGTYNVSKGVYGSQIVGNTAYLAGGIDGLLIVNVANPAAPSLLKRYASTAFDVSVVGQRAYIASGDQGALLILNVASPATPTLLGSLPLAGFAGRVRAVGTVAYVGVNADLKVVDASNPASPLLRGSAVGYASPNDIQVAGRFIYTAHTVGGIEIHWYAPATQAWLSAAAGVLTSPSDGTSYAFPAGSFSTPITVTHTPRFSGNLPSTGLLHSVNHSFDLSIQAATATQASIPAKPYTLSVTYSDAERGPAIEGTLAIYAWDGQRWVKLPTSTVNQVANKVTATTDRVGLFAVLGEAKHVFLATVQS